MSTTITNEAFTIVGGNHPASASSPDDWCSEIEYREVDICHFYAYLRLSHSCGCCYPPAYFFGLDPALCGKGAFPIPTDEGVSKSLPILPLGFHYAQASTDKKCGRARQGVWAKDRGKIYVAPFIQTTETIILKWDGKKRNWDAADPIDDDPTLHEALVSFAMWKHAQYWDKDPQAAAAALEIYGIAKAKLMRQCAEETRVRRCEPSRARSSPGTLYYNQEQSATAVCPSGQTGDPITQIIPANTVASPKSVADANVIAKKQAVDQANARLICTVAPTTYWNTAQTAIATCAQTEGAPIPDGNPVTRTVPANTFSSTASQAAADNLAMAEAERLANDGLSCTWWNAAQEYTASCPEGSSGSDVTTSRNAHTFSSTLSQVDADAKAINDAKVEAEDGLVCTGNPTVYKNTEQFVSAIRTACGAHPAIYNNGILVSPADPGCEVFVNMDIPADRFSSTTSQADANQQALNYGNNYVQQYAAGKCGSHQCGTYNLTFP